ncbi:hypothetical protein B5P45_27475 [Phyllobacterium zundukense]|uniref:Uncharacterized protein n=1 Tax=Phyllobacterium zundukense TaxID=1867719 RepID=A0A2N9VQC3_9HYPH|nr:hypothetical protein BLM14_02850 [Phyllobacterium zundukense]PIO41691.1 hypothetical protein B5P45_27475 [Phyllobacterium zundukense]
MMRLSVARIRAWSLPPLNCLVQEQWDVWVGHDEKRTANSYGSFDPEYLSGCKHATENIIAQL